MDDEEQKKETLFVRAIIPDVWAPAWWAIRKKNILPFATRLR